MGVDKIEIKDNIYDSTPQIHNALSTTGYTGSQMKKHSDMLFFHIILKDIGYAGGGDKNSKQKNFVKEELRHGVVKIEGVIQDESNDLRGDGMKIIIPLNIYAP